MRKEGNSVYGRKRKGKILVGLSRRRDEVREIKRVRSGTKKLGLSRSIEIQE